jgi:hypothetical protein
MGDSGSAAMKRLLVGLILGIAPLCYSAPQEYPESIPACEFEDGSGDVPLPCHWDGNTHGNGIGRSFINWPDGSVTYLN